MPDYHWGYDNRCSPWYISQTSDEWKPYTVVQEPYKSSDCRFQCHTFTDYGKLVDSIIVIALKLHLENPWYSQTINKYLTKDNAEKWYLASVESLITHNSREIGYLVPPHVSEFILNATTITDPLIYE